MFREPVPAVRVEPGELADVLTLLQDLSVQVRVTAKEIPLTQRIRQVEVRH